MRDDEDFLIVTITADGKVIIPGRDDKKMNPKFSSKFRSKFSAKFSAKQFLVSVDQTINTLLGGWADESISSRAHRENPRLEKIINTLFFWQKEHCRKSFQNEIDRMQYPPAFRDKPTV